MVSCKNCVETKGKLTSCHPSCLLLIKKDKADKRRHKFSLTEDLSLMCREHLRSENSRANSE
jgi:hypothetical protein